ncbi:Cutinase [Mycobacteroides abscessus subsp. abscessus]|uniref:cutinase family protein n=1 Tax=Mycobacteroides abscessus TaxID=36809 RepID=UPI00092C90A4|nr:cutinase family protein [Mycobacteroides abscessus]SIJ21525.1 Cutinase [Mycobacteroides abscessus subsp. abscessus]SLH38968.1 Cutinase [Mycobacteroides abscessus subsp. abscessus]
MTTHQLRRAIPATLTAATTIVTGMFWQPPTAAAAACPAVEAIAIPGTTQTSEDADPRQPVGLLGDILEPLKKSAKKLDTYYAPYPATIIGGTQGGGYMASKIAGIDSANSRLKTVAAQCPKTVFLLSGYSQGADAAGDVAAAIGNNKGVIPANRLLGVGLVADPSQAPIGQPTIGLAKPGVGFAGVRAGGFGSLTQRNGILSVCDPRDYYCNLPIGDVVMRFIGHLGSHLDASDPSGSAQKLSTIVMAGLIAPATAALNQILELVNDPQLIPNLIQRGIAFARALAQQLFMLAGPQVAGPASDLIATASQVINLITSKQWTSIPALIGQIGGKAAALGTALASLRDKTSTINTSGFAAVGNGMNQPGFNADNLTTALLNAVTIASGGVGTRSTGAFGPTFSQFSAVSVATAFKHFAAFINGDFHNSYQSTPLDQGGHTGAQIIQKYFANQITRVT